MGKKISKTVSNRRSYFDHMKDLLSLLRRYISLAQLLTRKEQSTIGEKQLTPDLVVKAGCQDNTFKSHESDCSSYYSCSNGQWLRLSCPGGLMWNKVILHFIQQLYG